MITIDDMKDKLLTLDQVQEKLASTEPLGTQFVDSKSSVLFEFTPTWANNIEDKAGTALVDATLRISGKDYQLTKDAAFQAGAAFGLPGKYASKVPSQMLEQQLNYWFSAGMDTKEFNILTVGQDQQVAAFTKPTINPFSNSSLMQEVVNGIRDRYGDTEIYADYKFHHDLVKTNIRFIIPEAVRTITGGGLADVPYNQQDEWAGGIHLTNSLIGKSQTKLESYLFRWWCTNGCITTVPDVGVWSRRNAADEETVYEWAANSVDEVLGGLETQFDYVQALTGMNIAGNVNDIVADIFDRFKVPVSQRNAVNKTLIEAEDLNMYTILNAITQTANDPTISDDKADKLLRTAGTVVGSTFDSRNARIWQEGHFADPESPNPYEIHQTA